MIKEFRVWDKSAGEWMVRGKDGRLIVYKSSVGSIILDFALDNPCLFSVQQFTGFEDRDGREIYEGDFVSFIIKGITHGPEPEEVEKALVWFDTEYGCWSFREVSTQIDYTKYDRIDVKTFKIIGNNCEK